MTHVDELITAPMFTLSRKTPVAEAVGIRSKTDLVDTLAGIE